MEEFKILTPDEQCYCSEYSKWEETAIDLLNTPYKYCVYNYTPAHNVPPDVEYKYWFKASQTKIIICGDSELPNDIMWKYGLVPACVRSNPFGQIFWMREDDAKVCKDFPVIYKKPSEQNSKSENERIALSNEIDEECLEDLVSAAWGQEKVMEREHYQFMEPAARTIWSVVQKYGMERTRHVLAGVVLTTDRNDLFNRFTASDPVDYYTKLHVFKDISEWAKRVKGDNKLNLVSTESLDSPVLSVWRLAKYIEGLDRPYDSNEQWGPLFSFSTVAHPLKEGVEVDVEKELQKLRELEAEEERERKERNSK